MFKCPIYWQSRISLSILQPAALFNTDKHIYWAIVSPDKKYNIRIYIMDKSISIGTQVYSKELEGHLSNICSLTFSNDNDNHSGNCSHIIILISECSKKIFLWHISLIQNTIEYTSVCIELASTTLQAADLYGIVTNVYFNPRSTALLLLAGAKICMYKVHETHLIFNAIMEGHTQPVTSVAYLSANFDKIVSISHDRTFCVWDLRTLICIYTSSLISSYPLICLTVVFISDKLSLFLIASSDATIRLYEWYHLSNNSYLTLELDLSILLSYRYAKQVSDLHKSDDLLNYNVDTMQIFENSVINRFGKLGVTHFCGISVLSCKIISAHGTILTEIDKSNACPHSTQYYIIILTNCYILLIDYLSGDIIQRVDLNERLTSTAGEYHELITGHITVYFSAENTLVFYALTTLKDETQIVFRYDFIISGFITHCALKDTSLPHVANKLPLIGTASNSQICEKKSKIPNVNKKPITSLNKPLTFHSKVKSSGYSLAPRSTRIFKSKFPTSNSYISDNLTIESSESIKINAFNNAESSYLSEYSIPTKRLLIMKIPGPLASIQCISLNCVGNVLACGIIDGSVLYLKDDEFNSSSSGTLLSKSRSKCVIASENPIISLSWSSCNENILLLSSKTECSLWKPNNLCYFRISQSLFPQRDYIHSAQYFSLDKYILVTHGQSISLFKYKLEEKCNKIRDEIKTYTNSNGSFKLSKSMRVSSHPYKVVACSVANEFYSSIAIIASSNRSLYLHDITTDQRLLSYPALESPVYSINQCPASKYNYASINDYNLFITSSLKTCINVWDIRCDKKLFNFNLHKNTLMPLSSKLSPCARYIATGSEDRCVYFYDIRMPSRLYTNKITGFSDSVTQLCFKPNISGIITTTLDSVISQIK